MCVLILTYAVYYMLLIVLLYCVTIYEYLLLKELYCATYTLFQPVAPNVRSH